eukprot:symbB.v1.2.015105.t1/scaffold1086.1/size139141/6
MAVAVRWRFHDVSTSAAAGKFIDFHSLETIFKKAEESTRKRLVMMSVRVEDTVDGKGSQGKPRQELKELGPVLMRDAMAHLLQEMVDTNNLDVQMRTAVLLAEHECWGYKPLGKVRGTKSLLVLKSVASETHEIWTDEKFKSEMAEVEVDEKLMEIQDELKLLGVEVVTAEKPKDASDFQQERDFDDQLMQPKNREKCLEYWWFAKHAYGEEALKEGLWEINSDGFRVIGKFGMVEDTLEIWIAFRGTSNTVEAIMDAHMELVPFILEESGESVGRVHLGFLLGFQRLRPLLYTKLAEALRGHSFRKVLLNVTGHSFGGAVATLCSYQLGAGVGNFEFLGMLRGIDTIELCCVT